MDLGWQVIRESIERLLDPHLASVVLFEALHEYSEGEELPSGMDELSAFLRGPLMNVLEARLSRAEAEAVIPTLEEALAATLETAGGRISFPELDIIVTDSEPPGRSSSIPAPQNPSLSPTMPPPPMEESEQPLSLLVVAAGKRLMFRIRAAFGSHRVTVTSSRDRSAIRQALAADLPPELVIVDGQDIPELSPVDLSVDLAGHAQALLVVVWAADQPWGHGVVQSLERQRVSCAPVPRSAGVEPLLDYVRARLRG
jgi:hypothetical protein